MSSNNDALALLGGCALCIVAILFFAGAALLSALVLWLCYIYGVCAVIPQAPQIGFWSFFALSTFISIVAARLFRR